MNINSIDQVIEKLEQIIIWSIQNDSRIGYFASLYLRVTQKIKEKIGTGYFYDDARMESLDINFAKRYLIAVEQYQNNDNALPKAWKVALEATQDNDLIILQQLLLSMNPHINIDLGAAAAETSPGQAIESLKGDFNKINDLLASLVPVVIQEINVLSPLIHLFTDLSGQVDDTIINFSLKTARTFAWQMALDLAPLSQEEQQPIIQQRNKIIAELGEKIIRPGRFIEDMIKVVHFLESKNVAQVIHTLNNRNNLPEQPITWNIQDDTPTDESNPPNRVYYFEIADGDWIGTFNFKLKSWKKLMRSGIGLKHKFLVILMTLFQKIFGDASISSKITTFPNEGVFGVAKNDFRIYKRFFTLFRSNEDYILSPNGSSVKVDARVRFGPISFLFNEHDVYPAVIWNRGFRATYHIKLLGGSFLGQYTVRDDKKQVHSILENEWAIADEVLHKIA